MDRKAAAEARRQKLLARGRDRLDAITGTIAAPEPGIADSAGGAAEAAIAQPPAAAARPEAGGGPAADATLAATGTAVATPAQAAATAAASTEAEAKSKPAAVPPPLSAPPSVPPPEQRQRRKGTAADGRWSDYESALPSSSSAVRDASQRGRAPPSGPLSAGDALAAAVRATARLRLATAAVVALLLSVSWDAQQAAAGGGPAAPPDPSAAAVACWVRVQAMWRGALAGRPPALADARRLAAEELPALAHAWALAWAQAPAAQAALAQLERLPPLAAVLLLSCAILGAALCLAASAPAAARRFLRPAGPRGLAARLADLMPGLAERLALLSAGAAALGGLADDAAMFVCALVVYRVLPQELGTSGGHAPPLGA
eukprot:scaffold1.g5465.t1